MEIRQDAAVKFQKNREMNKTWLLGGKSKSAGNRVLLVTLFIEIYESKVIDVK